MFGRVMPRILWAAGLFALVVTGATGCRSHEYNGPNTRWTQKHEGRERPLQPGVWDRSEMMAEYQVRFNDLNKEDKELAEVNRQLEVAISNGDQLKSYTLSKDREARDNHRCRSLIDLRLLRARLVDSGVQPWGIRLLEIQDQRTASEIRNNIEAYLKDDITQEVLIKQQDNLTYEEYGRRL